MKENSNSYCSSEGKNRSDKKSSASSQKKFGQRLEHIAHIFCCLPPPMECLNGKETQNSYCSSEGKNRSDKKSSASRQKKFGQQTKKVRLETRAYCTYFLLLTTPYVMFEWKRNSKFLLLIRRKEQIGQKKFGQQPKKVRLETRAYCTYYLLFTTPYGMFEWKRNSNSYCSSEGKNRPDKKSTASRQKKFGQRLEDFAHIFCC